MYLVVVSAFGEGESVGYGGEKESEKGEGEVEGSRMKEK